MAHAIMSIQLCPGNKHDSVLGALRVVCVFKRKRFFRLFPKPRTSNLPGSVGWLQLDRNRLLSKRRVSLVSAKSKNFRCFGDCLLIERRTEHILCASTSGYYLERGFRCGKMLRTVLCDGIMCTERRVDLTLMFGWSVAQRHCGCASGECCGVT